MNGLTDASESLLLPRLWAPQPGPQTDAITADWCPELFYGGAAGGGKSDFLLGDFVQDVPTYGAAWRGVLFRCIAVGWYALFVSACGVHSFAIDRRNRPWLRGHG